jgi:hypothetical protein
VPLFIGFVQAGLPLTATIVGVVATETLILAFVYNAVP